MKKKIFTLLTALVLCSSMSWAWWWGDNADWAYYRSSCTLKRETSIILSLKAHEEATYSLDIDTKFYFVVGPGIDYIPTGYYQLVETPSDQPYTIGTAIGDYQTGYHQVTEYSYYGTDYYGDYIHTGMIFVYNPNKESIPSYVLANFTTYKGWDRIVIIGTEPAAYSVIFHDEPDANGNTFEESAPSCADDNCTKFYPGTEIQLYPKPAEGYILSSWTGNGSEDIQYNAGGDYYYFIVGTKSYEITPVFEQSVTTPTVTINTPTNGSIVVKDANNNTITSGTQVEEGTVLLLLQIVSLVHGQVVSLRPLPAAMWLRVLSPLIILSPLVLRLRQG